MVTVRTPLDLDAARSLAEFRSEGRKKYIWRRGVLGWGGFTFISMTIFDVIFQWYRIGHLPDRARVIFGVILGLIIWPSGGYVWGVWTWKSAESRFIKRLTSQNNH